MTVRWGLGWAPALALSLLLVFLAALVIGFFCLKATGTAFLMLTLAFSQMVYAVAHKWTSITGGSDGLAGVARPLVTVAGLTLDFSSPILFGYLSFLVASGTYLLLRQVTRSPFGTVLVGIRENPLRMSALGFPVRRIQLFAFVLAALLAGTAGFFYALFNGFVSPEELYWPTSAMVLVMVILGGTGTLIGPMLGAAFVIWAEDLLSSATERWPMVVGGVFVLFVCAARGGFVGLWRRMRGGQGEPAAG
jgi:branched-chain amino acid transport system permease protein